MTDRYDIGQEFFRWEMATAVVGSILGINPFDQWGVELGKTLAQGMSDALAGGAGAARLPGIAADILAAGGRSD